VSTPGFLQHPSFFLNLYCTESITACSRTSYKIVPLINLNKYLHNDILDTAAINAKILYKEVIENTISRQNFISLADELQQDYVMPKRSATVPDQGASSPSSRSRQCQVAKCDTCTLCKMAVCSACTRNI